MKKTKIIIPALGMLLLSTAASVTGTVAWFSMNSFVNATQMRVLAKAEKGILISNEAKTDWNDLAIASHSTALEVYPTSTLNGTKWYHSTSSSSSLANTGNPYTVLSDDAKFAEDTAAGKSGAGYLNTNGQAGFQAEAGETEDEPAVSYEADEAYYLVNSFYIKSSAEQLTSKLYINSVTATTAAQQAGSAALNQALRVLVVCGSNSKIFAPFRSTGLTYGVFASWNTGDNPATTQKVEDGWATTTEVTAIGSGVVDTVLAESQVIPARSDTTNGPLQIKIYLYFEGEDAACYSDNITASLDTISVSVKFGTKASTNS